MKIIWKYELKIGKQDPIKVPAESALLSVQKQDGIICAWFLVETKMKRTMDIVYFGTGHELPETIRNNSMYKYIDTFQFHNGALVFHFFIKY